MRVASGYKRIEGQKLPEPVSPESYERVRWLQQSFERYNDYWSEEIARAVRNARFFWGVNFGQWPEQVVQKLINQGRRPPTYNITFDKMETMIGSIRGAGFTTRYEPMEGKYNSACMKLQDAQTTDRRHFDWDFTETMCFLDALIMVGYERMTITDKIHYLGNINWELLNPRRTLIDPRWMSLDPDDIQSYFTYGYFTPNEIADLSEGNVSEALAELRRREEHDGVDYGRYEGFSTYRNAAEKWGDRHLVIEFHHIRTEKLWWEYDRKNRCPFPDMGFKAGSEEDRQAKLAYVQKMGLGPDDIMWDKKRKVTKYIERIAPTINRELFVAKGKDRVQVGTCNILPLGWRYENQFQGLVDRLYDLNISINRSEMSMDSILTSSAKGAFILDKALAGGDPTMQGQIEDAWNDDAARIWVDEGSTLDLGPNGGIVPLPRSNVTADHFRVVDRRYELADKFSKVPAAQEARTDNAGEPNSLFENKQAVASLGQWMYSELQRRHAVKKALWYARQAKITYAGAPREFTDAEGEPFKINRKGYTSAGTVVTLDDFSLLPEMKVVVYPNKNSPTARLQTQSQAAQILPFVSNDPNDRLVRLVLTGFVIDASPLQDEQKDEAMKALKVLKMQAALAVGGSIQGMQQQIQMAQERAQAMMAGGAGPSLPQPGAAPQGPVGPMGKPVPQQFREGTPPEESVAAGTPQQEIAE